MMALQLPQIAQVMRCAGNPGVRGVEADEVRIVGVGVVRREVAPEIRRRGAHQHGVERLAIVVVFLEARVGREPVQAPQSLLLLERRLGRV